MGSVYEALTNNIVGKKLYDFFHGPDIEISIQILENLKLYLLMAVAVLVGKNMAETEGGPPYCDVSDFKKPACKKAFNKASIEKYHKYAEDHEMQETLAMINFYHRFDAVTSRYYSQRGLGLKVPLFYMPAIRKDAHRAIALIVESGTFNDTDKLENYINLSIGPESYSTKKVSEINGNQALRIQNLRQQTTVNYGSVKKLRTKKAQKTTQITR